MASGHRQAKERSILHVKSHRTDMTDAALWNDVIS